MTVSSKTAKTVAAYAKKYGPQEASLAYGLSLETVSRYMRKAAAPKPPKTVIKPIYQKMQMPPSVFAKANVMAIGDVHMEPGDDGDRLRRAGALAQELKVDAIVQIGDFGTFDSLNRFHPNHTLTAKKKPTVEADLEAVRLGLNQLRTKWNGPIYLTEGNHEFRIDKFVDQTPEVAGLLKENLHRLYRDYEVKAFEYGSWCYLGGVGFTHAAFNEMGKEYGGKTASIRIANDALHDVVWGHTHKREMVRAVKVGAGKSVRVLNLGSYMQTGRIEPYAKHSATGWTYGLYILDLEEGQIKSEWFIPEKEVDGC